MAVSRLLLLLSSLFVFQSTLANTQLISVRCAQSKDKTRVVLEFNRKFKYRQTVLHKPERIVIDLSHASIRKSFKIPRFKH